MQGETVEVIDGEKTITIMVTAVSVRQGMTRTRLRVAGQRVTDSDTDLQILRVITYPDMMAATISVKGLEWPMTFEQFIELPEAIVAPWEQAVYRLNPHWYPDPKAPTPAKPSGA